jgi:hypothetical protein
MEYHSCTRILLDLLIQRPLIQHLISSHDKTPYDQIRAITKPCICMRPVVFQWSVELYGFIGCGVWGNCVKGNRVKWTSLSRDIIKMASQTHVRLYLHAKLKHGVIANLL